MGARGPGARPKRKAAQVISTQDAAKLKPWEADGLTRAERVIAFIESLPITKGYGAGERVKLLPFQREWIEAVYATDEHGNRRVRTGLMSVARGQGKTVLAALLTLCHLCGPEAEQRGECYSAAATKEQASLIFAEMEAVTGLTGDVVIPRETDSPNVGWVAEDQALSTDGASFDSLTLTPHHVGVITELSRQLLQQSSPAVEQLVRNMMSRNVALEIDRAAIAGTGTGAEPLGLINDPNVPTVPFATDLFTTTADMIAAADVANIGDSRAFLSTNGVRAAAMKLRDTTDRPIAISETFHGEAAYFTNQAPTNLGVDEDEAGLVYGDWSDLLIGIWSQLDILVNPYAETAYSKGNILLRAMASVDFGVRRPASFVSATGVAS